MTAGFFYHLGGFRGATLRAEHRRAAPKKRAC